MNCAASTHMGQHTENIYYEYYSEHLSHEDIGEYLSYGIKVMCEGTELFRIRDVSLQLDKIDHLVKLCNEGDVSILHIQDIVEDFVAEY